MTVLTAETALQAGELIDASRFDVAALRAYYDEQLQDCQVPLGLNYPLVIYPLASPAARGWRELGVATLHPFFSIFLNFLLSFFFSLSL